MRNEFLKHRWAYFVLAFGMLFFVLAFFAVWPSVVYQRITIILVSIFYGLWGSLTHLKSDHFSRKVGYEYFGMAALAGLLMFLVTL